jgi:hypothetical protein
MGFSPLKENLGLYSCDQIFPNFCFQSSCHYGQYFWHRIIQHLFGLVKVLLFSGGAIITW